MFIHRNLVQAAIEAIEEIVKRGALADRTVAQLLKRNSKWGARDRRFVAQTIYDAVRWYRRWQALGGDNGWLLLGIGWILAGEELPNWEEFAPLNPEQIKQHAALLQPQRALWQSIPDWLDKRGEAELGADAWEKTLQNANIPVPLVIRANTLKISRNGLLALLHQAEIAAEPWGDEDAIVLPKNTPLDNSTFFKEGLFEVQSAASQQVIPFLQVQPDMLVVDACAGGGGKTLHAAAQMKNKGNIIALDIRPQALEQLQQRAQRAGVGIISTQNNVPLSNVADRVLIDAPCSGLGMLCRQPDKKWHLSNEYIDNLCNTQQKILQKYAPLCKSGGKLVYVTCSILPSENQRIAAAFSATEIGQLFEWETEQAILPDGQLFDGFYMARWRRR